MWKISFFLRVGIGSWSWFAWKGQFQPNRRHFGWKDGISWLPGISSLAQESVDLHPQERGDCPNRVFFPSSGLGIWGWHIFPQSVNHIAWIEWIYFLIFLSFNICIPCYMWWLPNFPSQLIVAPSNIHLSQRFYKFRNILPLALGEILLIIFQDYFISAKSYTREKNSSCDLQYVIKRSLTTEMKEHFLL